MKKLSINKSIKNLPFKLGMASLAIIVGIAEGIIITSSAILEGPQSGLKKKLNKIAEIKSFKEYYEELSSVKKDNLRVNIWRLQQKGLIEKKEGFLKLTSLGLRYFNLVKKDCYKKWDGKWRIIMFDIPEKIRRERYWLRSQLQLLEYKPLQKSVFLGKFPLDENLFKQITERRLSHYINLITIGEIDDEEIFHSFEL